MTTAEFIDELAKTRDTLEWRLDPDEGWAVERRSRPRYHIRGYSVERKTRGRVFDPIGAVCYRRTGKVYAPESWREASKALDLSPERAAELIAATHDRTWVGPVGRREPVEYLERLRSRLIAAVGPRQPAHSSLKEDQ